MHPLERDDLRRAALQWEGWLVVRVRVDNDANLVVRPFEPGEVEEVDAQRGMRVAADAYAYGIRFERSRIPPTELETVFIHEIGHLIGVGHTNVPGVMSGKMRTSRELTAWDRELFHVCLGSKVPLRSMEPPPGKVIPSQ